MSTASADRARPMLDCHRRKAVAAVGDFGQRGSLRSASFRATRLRCQSQAAASVADSTGKRDSSVTPRLLHQSRRNHRSLPCVCRVRLGRRGLIENVPIESGPRLAQPQSRAVEICAPSANAASFAHTTEGATGLSTKAKVAKPQSAPAMTRSRPMISA
jgi:hypothetical protein